MLIGKKQLAEIVAFDAANRGKDTRRCLRYNYIVPDGTKDPAKRDVSVCHVAVKIEKKTNRPLVKVVSVARMKDLDRGGQMKIKIGDIGYHGVAGWIVYWSDEDYERRATYAWILGGHNGEWEELDYKFGCGHAFPLHRTVNLGVLRETRYKYSQYEDEHGVGLVDWLALYKQDQRVELLAKAKLYQLICPAGLAALKDKKVFQFVRDNVVGSRYDNNRSSVRAIVWAAKHKTSIQVANSHFRFVLKLLPYLPRRTYPRYMQAAKQAVPFKLDYERVRKQIGKWGVEIREYARYIHEAIDYGLDMKNEGTLYPPIRDGRKTFMARLERLEAENAARHRREEIARKKEERRQMREANAARRARLAKEREYIERTMAARFAEIEAFQTGVERVRKVRAANGCTIVLAKTQEELRAEGRRMNNCVGCGTYGKGIVMGDKIIVMFKDAKGHSWCDAEIDRSNWTVRQCYARGNEKAPAEVEDMAHAIAAELRKMHAKHRKDKTFPELLKRRVA